ncbi:hypothetical protein J6590_015126 [Homalodisca vitripennis]|nr:hypothetical protein J6590_015126 [Homalodisca vitripennis]
MRNAHGISARVQAAHCGGHAAGGAQHRNSCYGNNRKYTFILIGAPGDRVLCAIMEIVSTFIVRHTVRPSFLQSALRTDDLLPNIAARISSYLDCRTTFLQRSLEPTYRRRSATIVRRSYDDAVISAGNEFVDTALSSPPTTLMETCLPLITALQVPQEVKTTLTATASLKDGVAPQLGFPMHTPGVVAGRLSPLITPGKEPNVELA